MGGETFTERWENIAMLIEPNQFYRDGYFTTIAANKGRQEWLNCLEKSIRKYNLYCQATESQIQEYLMGKYEAFLTDANTQIIQ